MAYVAISAAQAGPGRPNPPSVDLNLLTVRQPNQRAQYSDAEFS